MEIFLPYNLKVILFVVAVVVDVGGGGGGGGGGCGCITNLKWIAQTILNGTFSMFVVVK